MKEPSKTVLSSTNGVPTLTVRSIRNTSAIATASGTQLGFTPNRLPGKIMIVYVSCLDSALFASVANFVRESGHSHYRAIIIS